MTPEDEGIRRLFAAILTRAALDYRDLIDKGRNASGNSDIGKYSRQEIEDFLQSDCCNSMLGLLGFYKLSGRDLLMAANT